MEQTPQNTFDYDSCRRVWQRVSPELDPYPAGEGSAGCPAAPAPDLKRLQELIEGELGDRRAYLCAARCAPHPAARRTLQRMAADEGAHARRLLAVYYLACGQCYRPALPSGPAESLPWRALLPQIARFWDLVCADLEPRQRAGRLKQWLNLLRRCYPEAQRAFDEVRVMTDQRVITAWVRQVADQ